MSGPLTTFLAGDHTRLDGLLRRAITAEGVVPQIFSGSLVRPVELEITRPGSRTVRPP
jgi:hypothetical protein